MNDFTIISYPDTNKRSLLSLSQSRSRYMLPFGGRFRVVDFTIRNSFSSGARQTILYSDINDHLDEYVSLYGPFDEEMFPPIKVVSKDYSDIEVCYNLIMDSNSSYYIIYNGDTPSIIDFNAIIKRFKKRRSDAILYRLNYRGTASMAYKIMIIKQKKLLKVIDEARDAGSTSPNIFEMVINTIVNQGVKEDTFDAQYWPIKNIPEYYNLHWEIIWNPEIFGQLFKEKIIQSKIQAQGYAEIGPEGKISNSFMSDYCYINGKVENSIIYPGVEINAGSHIKDSIILPHVKIAPGAKITRSIIDERTDLNPENTYFNIGESCRIGSTEEFMKNTDFPKSLYLSITLVGKDNRVPAETRIGGACYVNSGVASDYFQQVRVLNDGKSAI